MLFKFNFLIFIALFVFGQALAGAQSSEHLDDLHEHTCFVCLSVLNDEHDELISLQPSLIHHFEFVETVSTIQTKQVLLTQELAPRPPATGPPSI